MTDTEILKSLYIEPEHKCCDNAEFYLVPPHNGCKDVKSGYGTISIKANDNWTISMDGNELIIYICPWCGKILKRKQI